MPPSMGGGERSLAMGTRPWFSEYTSDDGIHQSTIPGTTRGTQEVMAAVGVNGSPGTSSLNPQRQESLDHQAQVQRQLFGPSTIEMSQQHARSPHDTQDQVSLGDGARQYSMPRQGTSSKASGLYGKSTWARFSEDASVSEQRRAELGPGIVSFVESAGQASRLIEEANRPSSMSAPPPSGSRQNHPGDARNQDELSQTHLRAHRGHPVDSSGLPYEREHDDHGDRHDAREGKEREMDTTDEHDKIMDTIHRRTWDQLDRQWKHICEDMQSSYVAASLQLSPEQLGCASRRLDDGSTISAAYDKLQESSELANRRETLYEEAKRAYDKQRKIHEDNSAKPLKDGDAKLNKAKERMLDAEDDLNNESAILRKLSEKIESAMEKARTSYVQAQLMKEKKELHKSICQAMMITLAATRERESIMPKMEAEPSHEHGEHERERGGKRTSFEPKALSYSLTEYEIRKNPLTLQREEHVEQLNDLIEFLSLKDKNVSIALASDHVQQELCRTGETDNKTIQAAEAFITRALIMCMDERSERVQRFKIELKNNDLRTEIVRYPKVMMRMMDEFCMPSTTTEFRADKTRYQSKVYMTAGQSADALETAMHKIERDWKRTYPYDKRPFSIYHAILEKAPKTPEAQRTVEYWIQKLDIAELRRVDPESSIHKYEYGLAAFRKQLAQSLGRTSIQRDKLDARVGTVDDEWEDEEDQEHDAAAAEEYEYCDAMATGVQAGGVCWSCGKVAGENGHPIGECNKVGSCGFAFCPCNRGECCAVKGAVLIRPDTTILNAVCRPIPRTLTQQLASAQRQFLIKHHNADPKMFATTTSPPPSSRFQPAKGKGGRSFGKGGRGNTGGGRSFMGGRGGGGRAFGSRPNAQATQFEEPTSEPDAGAASQGSDDDEIILNGKLIGSSPSEQTVSNFLGYTKQGHAETHEPDAQQATQRSMSGTWVLAMLDRGANCHVGTLGGAERYADEVTPVSARVGGQGKGQFTSVSQRYSCSPFFENGEQATLDRVYDSPESSKFLINENVLCSKLGIVCDTEKQQLRWIKSGKTQALYTRGADPRFWMWLFFPVKNDSIQAVAQESTFSSQPPEIEANAASPSEIEAFAREVDSLEDCMAEALETSIEHKVSIFDVKRNTMKYIATPSTMLEPVNLHRETSFLPLEQTRPSHHHSWRRGVCPTCADLSMFTFCNECAATYCDVCNYGDRPAYGPWRPGPVEEFIPITPVQHSPPDHRHRWRRALNFGCINCDVSLYYYCTECGATYCYSCSPVDLPRYGPMKPGPVNSSSTSLDTIALESSKPLRQASPSQASPPDHRHSWQHAFGQCPSHDDSLYCVCTECGATWCDECSDYLRPRYGPMRPGPTDTEFKSQLVTPLWDEVEAGSEWDAELRKRLLDIGWRKCEGTESDEEEVPGLKDAPTSEDEATLSIDELRARVHQASVVQQKLTIDNHSKSSLVGPPNHKHTWHMDGVHCPSCDQDSTFSWCYCGANHCTLCVGGERPPQGPMRPGPVRGASAPGRPRPSSIDGPSSPPATNDASINSKKRRDQRGFARTQACAKWQHFAYNIQRASPQLHEISLSEYRKSFQAHAYPCTSPCLATSAHSLEPSADEQTESECDIGYCSPTEVSFAEQATTVERTPFDNGALLQLAIEVVAAARNSSLEHLYADHSESSSEPEASAADESALLLEASKASASTTNQKMLWASRLGVSAEGLIKAMQNTTGINISSPSVEERRLIDADVHRKNSIAKRKAAPHLDPARKDELQPGNTLIFDSYHAPHAPSVVNGGTFQLNAVCAKSAVGRIETLPKNASKDADAWFAFTSSTVQWWRSKGHKVYKVRFDQESAMANEAFKQRVESQLNVVVEYAPSKWHEGVGATEVNQDLLTRMAEAMTARAGLGPEYFLPAREAAQDMLNMRARARHDKTRWEEAFNEVPNLKTVPPIIFGATVSVYREKGDRGPNGSTGDHNGRTYEAKYIGRHGAGYIVKGTSTGKITYPRAVIPLNEHELMRDALPAGAAMHSTKQQTVHSDMPKPAPPRGAADPKIKYVTSIAKDQVPIGSRTKHFWLNKKGKSDDDGTWYHGEVIDIKENEDGTIVHFVKYEGYDEATPHDLAADRSSGRIPWAMERRMAKAPPAPIAATPQPLPPNPERQPDGEGMSSLWLYGGIEDRVNGVRERQLLRYPKSVATVLDAKNDPVKQDMTRRENRIDVLELINSKKIGSMHAAQPCLTFSPRSGKRWRLKDGQEKGRKDLPPDLKPTLDRHNVLTNFSIQCIEMCETRKIPVSVECSPDRGDPSTDAFWPEHADLATFWDMPRMKSLLKKGGRIFLVARCMVANAHETELMDVQKYYAIYVCPLMLPFAEPLLSKLECTHKSHSNVIGGKAPNGQWWSQITEEYPCQLNDLLVEMHMNAQLPANAVRAPKPPFSPMVEPPSRPAYSTKLKPLHEPFSAQAMLDRIIERDGEYNADVESDLQTMQAMLDAEMASFRTIHVDEATIADVELAAALSESVPSIQRDKTSNVTTHELAELVTGVKIRHPGWTRKEIFEALSSHGVVTTCSQVRKVKFEFTREQQFELDVQKATQSIVDVNTKIGPSIIKVPGSSKAVRESMEKEQWTAADQEALDVILVRGNVLVPITQVPPNTPIAQCVTARRLKKDLATGEIEKFKSRHAVDGKRLAVFRAKLGLPPEPRGTVNIIDDLETHVFCFRLVTNQGEVT